MKSKIKNQERALRLSKAEKISNDFLLQTTFCIIAAVAMLFIYNGVLYRYGSSVGAGMDAFLWVIACLFGAGAIALFVLWKLKDNKKFRNGGFYAAAAFVIPMLILVTKMPFTKYIDPAQKYIGNTKNTMIGIFMLLGLGVVACLVVYSIRMRNLKKRK